MRSLLWREYRLNSHILILGNFLLGLPYVIATLVILWPSRKAIPLWEVTQIYAIATVCSYNLSQLTLAFLAGNAIAGERADRSAEFMAYLPISRKDRVVSKLVLATVVTTFIWSINLLILWALRILDSWRTDLSAGIGDSAKYTVLTGLVMFGVAWFFSSLQSSPTIAVCGGIITPVLIFMGLYFAIVVERMDGESFATGFTSISVTLGTLAFAVGTWYFLKRVEP